MDEMWGVGNIFPALEHGDRIREVDIDILSSQLAMEQQFTALTNCRLGRLGE
jgi:hypothetical protein